MDLLGELEKKVRKGGKVMEDRKAPGIDESPNKVWKYRMEEKKQNKGMSIDNVQYREESRDQSYGKKGYQ